MADQSPLTGELSSPLCRADGSLLGRVPNMLALFLCNLTVNVHK